MASSCVSSEFRLNYYLHFFACSYSHCPVVNSLESNGRLRMNHLFVVLKNVPESRCVPKRWYPTWRRSSRYVASCAEWFTQKSRHSVPKKSHKPPRVRSSSAERCNFKKKEGTEKEQSFTCRRWFEDGVGSHLGLRNYQSTPKGC